MNGPDDQTRATLLEAARGLLERDGPNALTVRRIAAEAGMSTMNVYSRFGGKDGVVDELYCEGFHRLRAYVAKHGVSDDPLENFRAPGIAYRDFALENRTFYTVMFFRPIPGYSPSPSARQIAREGFDELVARMRELMDSGDIAAGDPHKVAACHWATCHGHVGLEISKVGPPEIDWQATLLSSLDALHASMS